ncbi:MAG: 50S ribosomal protein L20 [Elusimicrobia bacterium]|nr:50S ribosomal protein L20 [Elusimicrobiota bacterium]
MPRVTTAVATRHRKKKFFRIAKGYYSDKSHRWRMARQQVEKSLRHSYVGRKDKKGNFRRIWIARINAAARENGLSYSRLIRGIQKAKITLNRKMLAEMAVRDPSSFQHLASIAKSHS